MLLLAFCEVRVDGTRPLSYQSGGDAHASNAAATDTAKQTVVDESPKDDEGTEITGPNEGVVDEIEDFVQAVERDVSGDSTNYAVADVEDESVYMDGFCGLTSGPEHVISCQCCGDDLVGDPMDVARLKYNGRRQPAPAFNEQMEEIGKVAVWSFGSTRLFEVFCDANKPKCRCKSKTWEEIEEGCVPGDQCQPHPSRVMSLESSLKTPACSGLDPERISLGRGKCQDMAVEQCDRFFAKNGEKDEWWHCKTSDDVVKTCPAFSRLTEDQASDEKDMWKWVLEHAWRPDMSWDMDTTQPYIMKVSSRQPQSDLPAIWKQIDARLEEVMASSSIGARVGV